MHLIETTRTTLIHGDVPHSFRGDVVLIACYFINHMSFLVLDINFPYSILFTHEALHPLKVFGSICFVCNLSLGLINYLLDHTNVPFYVSLDHKKDINISLLFLFAISF